MSGHTIGFNNHIIKLKKKQNEEDVECILEVLEFEESLLEA